MDYDGILYSIRFSQGKDVRFVKGQVAHTVKGPKFVEGETVMTPDGLKFVVGVTLADDASGGSGDGKFVCGTLVDAGGERAQFMQGQLVGFSPENLFFVPGQMADDQEFVPGQMADKKFVPGQTVAAGKSLADPGQVFLNSQLTQTLKVENKNQNLGKFLHIQSRAIP